MIVRSLKTKALFEVVATVTSHDDDGNDVRTYWVRPVDDARADLTPVDSREVEEVR